MPSKSLCVYAGCSSVKRKDSDLTFHRFPQDEQTRGTWIARSGNSNLTLLSREQIGNARMCCKHFSEGDFIKYGTKGKRTVRTGALPSDAACIVDPVVANTAAANPVTAENSTIANSTLVNSKEANSMDAETADNEVANVAASNHAEGLKPNDNLVPVTISNAPISNLVPSRKTLVKSESPEVRRLKRLVQFQRAEIKNRNKKIKRLEIASKRDASAVAFAKAAYELNDDQRAFFKMQIGHIKKRQWTEYEKEFALSLYHKSPSAYKYLKDDKHFALPCVTLIRSWINDLDSSPGVNFSKLGAKVETMNTGSDEP